MDVEQKLELALFSQAVKQERNMTEAALLQGPELGPPYTCSTFPTLLLCLRFACCDSTIQLRRQKHT